MPEIVLYRMRGRMDMTRGSISVAAGAILESLEWLEAEHRCFECPITHKAFQRVKPSVCISEEMERAGYLTVN